MRQQPQSLIPSAGIPAARHPGAGLSRPARSLQGVLAHQRMQQGQSDNVHERMAGMGPKA